MRNMKYLAMLMMVSALFAANAQSFRSSLGNTLMCEDNWPKYGDFDFNDMIIEYQLDYWVDANGYIEKIEIITETEAIGASYDNGLAFRLFYPKSAILSVTDNHPDNLRPGTMSGSPGYDANGVENNATESVIIIYESAENVINRIFSGKYYNTQQGFAYSKPDSLITTILFKPGSNVKFFDPANVNSGFQWDAFLMVNGDRTREIHRPSGQPTAVANPAFFSTANDADGDFPPLRYVSHDMLPWLVDVNETNLPWMNEKIDMVQGYLQFANWAQAGGIYSGFHSVPNWHSHDPLKLHILRDDTKLYYK